MVRWAMVIDLKRCIGCFSCMIACKQEHFLPPGIFWNRILTVERGDYRSLVRKTVPVQCNHCEDAPCASVCPTGATKKREDGIVVVDSNACVGCRACVIACPYQQRSLCEKKSKDYFPGGRTKLEQIGDKIYPLEGGTVIKCNFCKERIEKGASEGLKPGVDRVATPACVITCPVSARTFGDLNDPNSEVSKKIKERKGYQLHPEYNTNPSVYYIE
jgi:phenylacetyl-CoA:acceptor oxidoreductase 27-kDa subunit